MIECGDNLIGNTSEQYGIASYKFILHESNYQVIFKRDSTKPIRLELRDSMNISKKYGAASYAYIDEELEYAAQTLSVVLSDPGSYYLTILSEFVPYPYNISIQCSASSDIGI